ncbi:MAG: hypothetical protein IIB38_15415, partial [Candidatus Hydrogenedentes bacterium]|nr:hypothetical protein [Candidatus Hydrogenedentota bacterium]
MMRFYLSVRCNPGIFGFRSVAVWTASLLTTLTAFAQTFINYESGQVHPIDVSPDGNTLAVCNTADNRIQLFDISSGVPVRPLPPLIDHVQVGIDPVSVRFLSNTELWAVNVISDTISVVDLTTGLVRQTIDTLDEPADVIFAGSAPLKAFVTCSAVDIVQVFDATNPALGPLATIAIDGEDPRALAVNADGSRVFAAIFESGNHSTILSGNLISPSPPIFPNAVDSANSPYAGSPNPPPNSGASFFPPLNPALPPPPEPATGQFQDALALAKSFEGGGSMIIDEPTIAFGMISGRPLFSMGEGGKKERLDITPLEPIKSFAHGGSVETEGQTFQEILKGLQSPQPEQPPPLPPTGPGGIFPAQGEPGASGFVPELPPSLIP